MISAYRKNSKPNWRQKRRNKTSRIKKGDRIIGHLFYVLPVVVEETLMQIEIYFPLQKHSR